MANLSFAREELARVGESLKAKGEPMTRELDDVLEALGEAAEGALRLKHIVQDLRTLSRKQPEYQARVEVQPVLENALKLIRSELNHRARLKRDFREIPEVDADEARLSQLFLNLLLNAVQSMEPAEAEYNVLRVAAYTGEDGEVVVVQDTGRGLRPEALSRIFEPFVASRPGSSGLGLSVSHAILPGLGGTLRAESRQGRGTLITITLPPACEALQPQTALLEGRARPRAVVRSVTPSL